MRSSAWTTTTATASSRRSGLDLGPPQRGSGARPADRGLAPDSQLAAYSQRGDLANRVALVLPPPARLNGVPITYQLNVKGNAVTLPSSIVWTPPPRRQAPRPARSWSVRTPRASPRATATTSSVSTARPRRSSRSAGDGSASRSRTTRCPTTISAPRSTTSRSATRCSGSRRDARTSCGVACRRRT